MNYRVRNHCAQRINKNSSECCFRGLNFVILVWEDNYNYMKKIIIQARIGSSRLPAKVLKDIGGSTSIELIYRRLLTQFSDDELIFAIPDTQENDVLYDFILNIGALCVRGDEDNVYARFCKVLETYPCDTFIRITADCPLIDPIILRKAFEFYESQNFEIVHSGPLMPEGLDFEILAKNIFLSLKKKSMKEIHYQHPTLFFYEAKETYKIHDFHPTKNDDSIFRITLDEKADLVLLQKIAQHFSEDIISLEWEELRNYLINNPQITNLNSQIIRNEGLIIDKDKLKN